jgi:hypothetical protein
VWQTYQLGQTVHRILNDPIIGVDGDLTETRDYSSYVRQMDEIAALNFKETAPYIRSGSIGDIGCSVGSWIKQGGAIHTESDFYGIELARNLFDICLQRKHNGEFTNPNTFFSMKNAVSDLVFRPDSMTTIHTGSITHEIFSYGSREDLLKFIGNRFRELQPGGVWINRDVVGPEKDEQQVFLHLSTADGVNDVDEVMALEEDQIAEKLHSFSTYCRFLRFANDFLFETPFDTVETKDSEMNAIIQLSLRDAAEFLLTKDYTDNWNSEMQEQFCFWSCSDWTAALREEGFRVVHAHAYQNPWIAENRWLGKVKVTTMDGERIKDIPTNVLLVAERIISLEQQSASLSCHDWSFLLNPMVQEG